MKATLTATARKLLCVLNSMIADGTYFRKPGPPEYSCRQTQGGSVGRDTRQADDDRQRQRHEITSNAILSWADQSGVGWH